MTGVNEILVLILLIVAILILPRMFRSGSVKNETHVKKRFRLTPLARAGIVLSLVYPVFFALSLKPWEDGQMISFFSIGILPVILAWSIVWIITGRKQ